MKRYFLRGLGLLALAVAAQPAAAADLPVKAPVVRAPASAIYSWTGCYLGAHVGGLWGKTRHHVVPTVTQYELDVDFPASPPAAMSAATIKSSDSCSVSKAT